MFTATGRTDHSYDTLFYEYQREGSMRSARGLLPIVMNALSVRSVLDIGCGAGAWLAAYQELGVTECLGVDGDYVDRQMLLINESLFRPCDIAKAFDLNRTFDLVQCLEVAEHVPRQACDTLVDNIIRHGHQVLFSAAVPGQGGEHHVNERNYDFWRNLFASRGYRFYDFVRPRANGREDIEPWYRYNVMFFVHDSAVQRLPSEIAATRIPDGAPIRDFSPVAYRLRKTFMRLFPEPIISMLAVLKHKLIVRSLQRRKRMA
jgi:SAM-dependent methyltransferase